MSQQPPEALKHFDGKRFFNPHDRSERGGADVVKWAANRKPAKWSQVDVTVAPAPHRRVEGDTMRATWVGHATVLVQVPGLNLLTDPVWSARCSPISFAGPKRFAKPGVEFDDLPHIDLVLISHNHYDHLDESTARRLIATHQPHFVVPVGVGEFLTSRGAAHVTELDWWQSTQVGAATVHAVPVQHFSGRGMFDRDQSLWVGFVVETPVGRFFFAGDTGYSPDFKDIGARFAPVRLAAIPIGAYAPRWFMSPVHVDPDEAVRIHKDVGARCSLGIHHGTFQLTDEPQGEPAQRLLQHAAEQGLAPGAFVTVAHGESMEAPALGATSGDHGASTA